MWGYYLFALFVFVLCAVLVLFAKFLFSAKRKPEDIKMQEEKLLRLYRQIEDMMESFEEYAEEVRVEIAQQKKDITDQLAGCEERLGKKLEKEIKDKTKSFEKPVFQEITTENVIKPAQIPLPVPEKPQKQVPMAAQAEELERMKKEHEKMQAKENGNSDEVKSGTGESESRNDTIVRLYKEGKSEGEIAKLMNMNSSEIRLIIGMNNR